MMKQQLILLLTIMFWARADIELRVGAFIPKSSLFRDIYGSALPTVELELSKGKCQRFMIWSNLNWSGQKGHSIGLRDDTTINLLNFSLGPKVIHNFNECNQLYIGIGPTFSGVWIKNNVQFNEPQKKVSKTVFGAVFKFGFCHNFARFFIDAFADYYYQPRNFETRVDLGGLRTGLGFGFKF